MTVECTFPGTAAGARDARHWLSGVLDAQRVDEGAAETAAMVLAELAQNAVRHSRSSRPGGTFTVAVLVGGSQVHLEVTDAGSDTSAPLARRVGATAESGRGLDLVERLAATWQVHTTADSRTVTAEIARADVAALAASP